MSLRMQRPSVPGCLIQGKLCLPAAGVLKKYSRAEAVHSNCQPSMKKTMASAVDLTLSDDEPDAVQGSRKRHKATQELQAPQQAVSNKTGAAAETASQDEHARRRIMQQAQQVCQGAAHLCACSQTAG